MSDMKCPFCKKELKLIGKKSDSGYPLDIYVCSCSACPETVFSFGNTVMWNNLRVLHENLEERRERCELAEKELIRTRKALDIAVKRLGYIKNNYKSWTPDRDEQMIAQAVNGLDEIKTALEQKD